MPNVIAPRPYRCPNVDAIDLGRRVPDSVAFCNYTDCSGCVSQRRLRLGSMPEPTVTEDDWAMDQVERDAGDARFADGADEPRDRDGYVGQVGADLGIYGEG